MNVLVKRKIQGNWEILLLLLLPILLLLINQVWIFTPNGTVDPWVYFGYFIRLKQYSIAFPDGYYGTRLSWILPGYLAYSLFPSLVANYVLHLGFYYLATFSLYFILRPSVGRRAAFLTSASMGCYAFFLLAIGWDYVDGAGIAYFLLTVLMLSWAARKEGWVTWMVLSGAFFGALIYTNLVWLALAPSLITYYLLTHRPHQKQKTSISVGAFIVGILAITLLLCSVNYAVGGRFFFFIPSVNYVLNHGSHQSPWRFDWYDGSLLRATWLILPTIVLLVTIALLAGSKFRKSFEQADTHLQVPFVMSCLGMMFLTVKGLPGLHHSYYASYLIPSMFLAIGASLKSLATLSNGSFAAVASLSLILIIFPLVNTFWSSDQPIILCCLFLAAIVFSIASNFNQKKVARVLAILLFTVSASISFDQGWNPNQSVKQLQSNALNSKASIDSHLTVSGVQKLFRDIDPTVRLFFWYSPKELEVYQSVSSASLWGYRFINEDFPGLQGYGIPDNTPLSSERLSYLKQHFTITSSKIAIFSQQEDALQQAINSLKTVGFTAKSIATYPIKQDTIAFTITIIEVTKLKDTL